MAENFEVCPDCNCKFFTNEYKPEVLETIDAINNRMGIIPELVQRSEFESAMGQLKALERLTERLHGGICNMWDSEDSNGYHAYCNRDEDD